MVPPLRSRLHVWREKVVLVDANFQAVLHSSFVYGNVPLDGCLGGTYRSQKQKEKPRIGERSSPGPAARPAYDSEPSLWAPEADRIPEDKHHSKHLNSLVYLVCRY